MAGSGKSSTPRQRLLGQRVRERRLKLGLTQEAVAERAGMHPVYISLVERGHRNPSLDNVVRLAVALQCDPGRLVTGLDKVDGRAGSGGHIPTKGPAAGRVRRAKGESSDP